MLPLLAQEKSPAFARLIERGSFGYLDSLNPTMSPVIWTSIATGKVPAKHGIKHFVYRTTENGTETYRLYSSGHRKTKASGTS